jgi:hypothetical protein
MIFSTGGGQPISWRSSRRSHNQTVHTHFYAPSWKLIAVRALFSPRLFARIRPFLAWIPALDLISIFEKQRRCLHDYFCSTLVVKIN